MPRDLTLSRRYAKALLQVCLEQKNFAAVEGDLYGIADAYDGSSDLRAVLGSPTYSRERKKEILRAVFADKVEEVTLRFLDLLVEKRRIRHLREIAEAFDEANDEACDVAKATVTSFLPLTKTQRAKLNKKLQAFTHRSDVRLEEKVDSSLLGGITVKIGDAVLDGSIRGRLQKLEDTLTVREEEIATRAAGLAAQAVQGA